jgi:cyclopropane fatty-acyl-phospholipid synthase-like methyltransferase
MNAPFDAAFWNDRYRSTDFAYGEAPNIFLTEAASHLKPVGKILVPGDGEGRNGVWLARQGFDVTTIDLSEEGCAKAEKLAQRHSVPLTVICADLAAWEWPQGHFDGVVSIFLHVPSQFRPRLHGLMRKALRDDGILIIEAFEPNHLTWRALNPAVGGPGNVDMLYDLDDLKADFAPMVEIFSQVKVTDLAEGIYHKGKGSVVRAVFKSA